MPPTVAIVCLIVGLGGVLLYTVGFSLPYWYLEPDPDNELVLGVSSQTTRVSHGLWQTKTCQDEQCHTEVIDFGLTSAFEACRVFCCATVVLAVVSFCFTVFLVKSPRRVWSTRTSAVWACTALFNCIATVLFGSVEKKTLEVLDIPGIDPAKDLASRLSWAFWLTVASLALFVLLAVSCGVYACTQLTGDESSGNRRLLSNKKQFRSSEKQMQEERLARLDVQDANTGVLYPHLPKQFSSPSHTTGSIVTTKTGDAFPPASYAPSNQPSVYSVNKTSTGYAIQPNSAAVNIDNRRPVLSALDTPYYLPGPASSQGVLSGTHSTGTGVTTGADNLNERVILNHPNLAPSAGGPSVVSAAPSALSVPRNPDPNDTYSLNIKASAIPGHRAMGETANQIQSYNTADGFTVAGPPPYTTLPRSGVEAGSVTATFSTVDAQYRM